MNGIDLRMTRRGFLGATAAITASTAVWASRNEPQRFQAGAATSNITLPLGAANGGVIARGGKATGVHDELHARCLAFDDGHSKVAIAVCDVRMIGRGIADQAKRLVHEATGWPTEGVLIAATRTHAAPAVIGMHTDDVDQWHSEFVTVRIADGLRRAIANQAPAKVGFGSFQKPEFVRCRRHLCEPGSVGVNPFGLSGEQVKSVAGTSSAVIEPAGPVDPQVSLLSVQHADGTPMAVLGNFSVHYCGGYRAGFISADYFGSFARELEKRLPAIDGHPPFVGIMSNGTSGNMGALDFGGKKYGPFEWVRQSGRILAKDALPVIGEIEHRDDVTLSVREQDLQLDVRLPDEARLAWAKRVLENPQGPHPHPWTTIYAQEALHLAEYPSTIPVKLQAIRIGDVGMAAVPCEVFSETGLAIKAQSPLRSTFTMELANGYNGYLPTPEQHKLGGYETWPARSSYLEVGAESKIRSTALDLLKKV